jgi:hypothetical protein
LVVEDLQAGVYCFWVGLEVGVLRAGQDYDAGGREETVGQFVGGEGLLRFVWVVLGEIVEEGLVGTLFILDSDFR